MKSALPLLKQWGETGYLESKRLVLCGAYTQKIVKLGYVFYLKAFQLGVDRSPSPHKILFLLEEVMERRFCLQG